MLCRTPECGGKPASSVFPGHIHVSIEGLLAPQLPAAAQVLLASGPHKRDGLPAIEGREARASKAVYCSLMMREMGTQAMCVELTVSSDAILDPTLQFDGECLIK